MSTTYRAVDWNRQKRRYDTVLILGLVLGMALFGVISQAMDPNLTLETIVIRASAVAAVVLLHVILGIGPLARLDARYLPLLYNRRHLGVCLFLLALFHVVFATLQFHGSGNENPIVSLFTSYASDFRPVVSGRIHIQHVPFEPFGAAAWVVFLLMAATSHDFWLRNLGSAFWKALHLGVYLAYGLVLTHVALGALQTERSAAYPVMLALGFLVIAGLHLAAAHAERRKDQRRAAARADGFLDAGPLQDLTEGRGRTITVGGQRMAVYLVGDRVFALSNVCRHQGGPLGEGRILDGCVTCPWHGWNYQPEDGCSPPPFQERVPTFEVRLVDDRVWVRPIPLPLGTRSDGAPLPSPPPAVPVPSPSSANS